MNREHNHYLQLYIEGIFFFDRISNYFFGEHNVRQYSCSYVILCKRGKIITFEKMELLMFAIFDKHFNKKLTKLIFLLTD